MSSRWNYLAVVIACFSLTTLVSLNTLAGDPAAKDTAKHDAFDAIKSLEGTWVRTEPGPDGTVGEVVFKSTAAGSVMMETMFPGHKHEMVNAYHMDGDNLIVTHYCAQGVQPRMKLVSHENNTLKFVFLDCTNLKPGEGHMGGLEITINGDQLIEKWAYLKDGQVVEETPFEFTKKQ